MTIEAETEASKKSFIFVLLVFFFDTDVKISILFYTIGEEKKVEERWSSSLVGGTLNLWCPARKGDKVQLVTSYERKRICYKKLVFL